jgi:UDP-N-acetylmuramoyl-tripeptide--D-alanyl-D-alanine ligase
MGMNHAGEIARMAAVARPRIGVVTNVGYAHIENFAAIEGIAAAKRELIEALPSEGIAVLNGDDPRVRAFAAAHPGRSLTFGLGPDAEVRATDVAYGPEGARFTVDGVRFVSPLAGPHNVRNVLAGIAVAGIHGLAPASLTEAVRALSPLQMRGEQFTWRGVLVYNDCYNSNPEAVRSMIDVLKEQPAQRRIAVLGEMLELGHWAEPLHREVGSYVAAAGVNLLVGIRGAACHMVDAAKGAGQAVGAAFFFETPEEAGDFLRTATRAGDAILFKGSRGVQVERALERWMA